MRLKWGGFSEKHFNHSLTPARHLCGRRPKSKWSELFFMEICLLFLGFIVIVFQTYLDIRKVFETDRSSRLIKRIKGTNTKCNSVTRVLSARGRLDCMLRYPSIRLTFISLVNGFIMPAFLSGLFFQTFHRIGNRDKLERSSKYNISIYYIVYILQHYYIYRKLT